MFRIRIFAIGIAVAASRPLSLPQATLLRFSLPPLDSVFLLPNFIFVVVVRPKRVIWFYRIPHLHGRHILVLISINIEQIMIVNFHLFPFAFPTPSLVLGSFEPVDILIENHGRRLDFLAPSLCCGR